MQISKALFTVGRAKDPALCYLRGIAIRTRAAMERVGDGLTVGWTRLFRKTQGRVTRKVILVSRRLIAIVIGTPSTGKVVL
jgi:hypothetical protein